MTIVKSSRFRPLLAIFGLLLPSVSAGAGHVSSGTRHADALSLYGNEIYFDVYREDEKVGFHRVGLDKAGEDLLVRSTFELKVDFLFFTAFRYLYRSEARWRRGLLNSLKVTVDDDGRLFTLDSRREGERMTITNPNGRYTANLPLFPTNHWNAAVLGENRVLNTLTGRINNVQIVPTGREAVVTERGRVSATRYTYTGDLDTEVWYDDAGRWVKMRFKGRDGSNIEYVCRRCQGTAVTGAADTGAAQMVAAQ